MYLKSLDKIVLNYFHAVAARDFTYQGALLRAQLLTVSPLVFRGFTCPSGCGGCCPRFSLVYLPQEQRPYEMECCTARFNERDVFFYQDAQTDHQSHHCRNLDQRDGRCLVHGRQPFSCDFELLRVTKSEGGFWLGQRLYGRGWNMLRVDGERGAKCSIIDGDETWKADTARKLRRLKEWTDHCGITTRIDAIVQYIESGPHAEPLKFEVERS